MSEPFVAEIRMFAGNFAPRGWAFCDGQLLAVSQNDALFSLIGTIYGGDGRTTFALPDLRGRSPMHQGTGPGLSPRPIGSTGGSAEETLTLNQLPSHNHTTTSNLKALNGPGNAASPVGNHLAGSASGGGRGTTDTPHTNNTPDATLQSGALAVNGSSGNAGGSQPHDNMQPFLGINFIIALFGIYPSRT